MKQKSIYSLYGTKNKEQLYNKLKTNPEKVKELVELMNYLKMDKANERISINNPSQLGEIIEAETDKEIIGKCLKCGSFIYENRKSYYCSNYKEGCKFNLWKESRYFDQILKITKEKAKKTTERR